MKNIEEYSVSLDKLSKVCRYEEELDFCSTSEDVSPLEGIVGQERAVKAMEFGLFMEAEGYNIFVVGPPGTGKSSYSKEVVTQMAAKMPVPDDWCYIYNFSDGDKPLAVSLPAGKGREFQKDMEVLISDIKNATRKVFESSDYELKKNMIFNDIQQKMEELYRIIEQKAFEDGFSVKQDGLKFIFVPLIYGRPMLAEEFSKLSDEEHKAIEEKRHDLGKNLDKILYDGHLFEKKITEQMVGLDKETTLLTAGPLVNALKEKYSSITGIVEYLDKVLVDVGENCLLFKNADMQIADIFRADEGKEVENEGEASEPETIDEEDLLMSHDESEPFTRYKVNLFINNESQTGAPVIIESNPYYYSVFGKIEYKSQIFVTSTDFTMIKPGAIHQANGGYLILQAKDIITDPFVWDALKKSLKYGKAAVENIGEQYRTVPTVTLKPAPIPLNVKVVLIGTPLYYLVFSEDEDFQKLFKIKVDFDYEMPRNNENLRKYVSFVSSICRREKMKHFNKAALAAIIEYASRMAGDQKKMSTKFDEVSEIVYEAIAWAKVEGVEMVDLSHVKKAINERKYRFNKLEEKVQEEILQKKIIIDTKGNAVGQVNGLFIIESEGYSFGLPARITAITHVGRGGVINIERETEMSGNIHSKGVLTLAGYLGGKLAQEKPLGFTAQVTFEQVYEGVEGDSASSAELYAIISSLAGIPLKQSLAVTGSVDQRGEIQPIGSVNEKIEGFFDICNAEGLTGEQGVIIPTRNIDNLMLKDEVIDAVRNGKFHVYAINNIEEGIELLSGIPAGTADENGRYQAESVFARVDKKLQDYNKALENIPNDQQ